jgi:hypothetical protein
MTRRSHATKPPLVLPETTPAPSIDRIARLAGLRRQVAAAREHAGTRELDARLLRLEIANDLRRSGCTKTDAEILAKADPRYVAHERETLRLDGERARWEAEAESLTFSLTAQSHAGALAVSDQLAVATLLAPWWARATPVEQQWLLAGAVRLARLAGDASSGRAIDPAPERRPVADHDGGEDPF